MTLQRGWLALLQSLGAHFLEDVFLKCLVSSEYPRITLKSLSLHLTLHLAVMYPQAFSHSFRLKKTSDGPHTLKI